jgi:hypothetical protein
MSDAPQDSSWWQGVDGKWYPPIARAETSVSSGSTEPPSAPAGASKKWIILGIVAVIVLGGVVAMVMKYREPATGTVIGSFTLIGDYSPYGGWNLDKNCNPSGGYSDIGSSTQVVVKNKEGLELARTDLGLLPVFTQENGRRCAWSFVLKIPKGEEYYILSVGSRGEMKYSFEEITSVVTLSLGGK